MSYYNEAFRSLFSFWNLSVLKSVFFLGRGGSGGKSPESLFELGNGGSPGSSGKLSQIQPKDP